MTMIVPKGAADLSSASNAGGASYSGIRADVLHGLQSASAKTGVDFHYLLAQAKIESGLDPNIKAPTSSASGLFQFIQSTWLTEFKEHGAENGADPRLVNAVKIDDDGQASVSDSAMRKQILALRNDPRLASALGAEFAADNRNYLEDRLGRKVNGADLYMAHFLGPAGASKFLGTLASKPSASAAALFPAAAGANHNVFYSRDGQERSVSEVYNKFAHKIANAGDGAVAAVTEQAVEAGKAAVVLGTRVAESVVNTATALARKFMPSLSPETVLTLASLPMPGKDSDSDHDHKASKVTQLARGVFADVAINTARHPRKEDGQDQVGSTAWTLAHAAATNPITTGL